MSGDFLVFRVCNDSFRIRTFFVFSTENEPPSSCREYYELFIHFLVVGRGTLHMCACMFFVRMCLLVNM